MAQTELIIFDCDGVLVDSEPIAMRVLLSSIARAGVTVSPETGFRHFLGRSFATIGQSLEEMYGLRFDDRALEQMRLELYETYRHELRPMAGLLDSLDQIGLPLCVASSSQMERIAISLEITGLAERMKGAVFSASMVPNGKPAPDLFLHAASKMGAKAGNCVVIEDSPAGIVAAKKAGMQVIAFTGGGHIEASGLTDMIAALKPDGIISDMRDLPEAISALSHRETDAEKLLVAVDVGTGSARAGVVSLTGELRGRSEHPIQTRRHSVDQADHDSSQIWTAVCAAVRGALTASGASGDAIVGISFDATCSLVVRSASGDPLPVSDSEARWDTIVWFDHRAIDQAETCTSLLDPSTGEVGRAMSPEMQLPKLMWLKQHQPRTWSECGLVFDLADFLTWKASGSTARSHCTLTCKWNWTDAQGGWPSTLLRALDLDDLRRKAGLPDHTVRVGHDLGPLTVSAAAELGLTTLCRVAAGSVDAHAGALGALGPHAADPAELHRHLVLVAGTSSCVMALSDTPRGVSGAWGPFGDVVLPGTWLTEAGQSASGALLDFIVQSHPAGRGGVPDILPRILERIGELRAQEGWSLARNLHVLPDFHGNRSPEADPRARGMIVGLGLESDFDSLCRLYWRTALSLALGIRRILQHLRPHGFGGNTLLAAGGHTHNPLLMELYAEVTGCRILEPSTDLTLLGCAMIAAVGAGAYADLTAAAYTMQQPSTPREPTGSGASQIEIDAGVLLELVQLRQRIAGISSMSGNE